MGYPQTIAFNRLKDCLMRTKKKTGRSSESFSNTEDLFWEVISRSSIVQHKGEKSFRKVCEAVHIFEKFLCGGQWCIRTHCKHYCSASAWNCSTTRPAVCNEFQKYVLKRAKKERPDLKEGDEAKEEIMKVLTESEYFACSGFYFDENLKKFVSYERTKGRFYLELNKLLTDALMFFLKHDDRELAGFDEKKLVYNSLQD